ncbi:MAG: hypothetical protein ACR2IR_10145 [Acidimicrobiia bacterium]
MKKLLVCSATVIALIVVTVPASASASEGTPKSCIRALDSAEEVASTVTEALGLASGLLDLNERAFTAIANEDVGALEDLIAETDARNLDLEQLALELTPQIERYNRQAAKCRAA